MISYPWTILAGGEMRNVSLHIAYCRRPECATFAVQDVACHPVCAVRQAGSYSKANKIKIPLIVFTVIT